MALSNFSRAAHIAVKETWKDMFLLKLCSMSLDAWQNVQTILTHVQQKTVLFERFVFHWKHTIGCPCFFPPIAISYKLGVTVFPLVTSEILECLNLSRLCCCANWLGRNAILGVAYHSKSRQAVSKECITYYVKAVYCVSYQVIDDATCSRCSYSLSSESAAVSLCVCVCFYPLPIPTQIIC